MLNFFNEGDLPGDVEGPFASRDTASFYEIWQAARQIETACLLRMGQVGWAPVGN